MSLTMLTPIFTQVGPLTTVYSNPRRVTSSVSVVLSPAASHRTDTFCSLHLNEEVLTGPYMEVHLRPAAADWLGDVAELL